DTVDVSAGDMVTKGDIIGTVGTTGYSTGPHLHFEVKIGSMSLDPWSLFDGTSGLYTFDSTMEEKQ
ncbi:MAG: M23 family metallopeptidase, partial [Firmicutes bacterium]|nr:M23 family metallopeptidase [Bacillota bacterium]